MPNSNLEVLIKRKNLPDKPGVYIYKDQNGKVIYVGKAKSLIKRVSQYFQSKNYGNTHDEILYGQKIKTLVENIADIDFIVTENEKESLILENEMIKKYQPRYNALLKDDKSFPWILITYSEEYPRILIIRQPNKIINADGKPVQQTKNKFIGPFIDVKPMKNTLKMLRKYFPYCTCKRPCKKQSRPCINYQIKLCPAPCSSNIDKNSYLENIKNIERILNGDISGITNEFQQKMVEAAKNQEFEQAAKYRDIINALKVIIEKQSVENYQETEKINRDIIGFHKTLTRIGILILHVRDGKMIGKTPFIIESNEKLGTDDELLFSMLSQYYLSEGCSIPDEIILPDVFFKNSNGSNSDEQIIDKQYVKDSAVSLESAIKERVNKDITIRSKGSGHYTLSLLKIAERNVQLMIKLQDEYDKMMTEADALSGLGFDSIDVAEMKKEERESLLGLSEIKDLLQLDNLPRIIEGFDISNWQQGDATGSMVTFIDGRPSKANYRSFIIKKTTFNGDYAMLQEVISRRYKKLKEENGVFPDLVIVDGGKAQVSAAVKILDDLNINIPVVGLEKTKSHTEIDRIVVKLKQGGGQFLEHSLEKYTHGYNILQHISKEYHRRAIQHHRQRMEKRVLKSPLSDIPGIGEKTKDLLIQHFGSIDIIKNAKIEDFQAIFGPKKGENILKNIKEYFNSTSSNEDL